MLTTSAPLRDGPLHARRGPRSPRRSRRRRAPCRSCGSAPGATPLADRRPTPRRCRRCGGDVGAVAVAVADASRSCVKLAVWSTCPGEVGVRRVDSRCRARRRSCPVPSKPGRPGLGRVDRAAPRGRAARGRDRRGRRGSRPPRAPSGRRPRRGRSSGERQNRRASVLVGRERRRAERVERPDLAGVARMGALRLGRRPPGRARSRRAAGARQRASS